MKIEVRRAKKKKKEMYSYKSIFNKRVSRSTIWFNAFSIFEDRLGLNPNVAHSSCVDRISPPL